MSSIKKKFLISLLFLTIFYFLTRLVNLTSFPLFCDEAIYIRWSQIMRSEATLRFLPLSDGKQPLFMWLLMPILKFVPDPLFAGRLLSVLSGWTSLIGIFALSFVVFNSFKISFFSSFVYIILPYTLFFDRMALVDSLLLSFGIWLLVGGILLAKYKRIDLAMISGMSLGGALITKSPALFFCILFPLTILALPSLDIKKKEFFNTLSRLILLWLIVYFLAFMIQNILKLGPNYHMIALRNKDYVFSLKEVLKHPQDPFVHHLKNVISWFFNLFTPPLFFLAILGKYLSFKTEKRSTLLLLSWVIIPLLAQCFFAKVFTSRYLLFTIFPLITFIGVSLEKISSLIKSGTIRILLFIFLFACAFRYNFLLLFSPYKAPLTTEMKKGYLFDWTSGTGISQVRDFLKKESEKGKIIVGTEGYFGTLPDGLSIYFDKNKNITIFGVGIDLKEIPASLREASLTTPTYLVINQSRLKIENDQNLELILKIPKGEISPQTDYLALYKINP